MAALVDKVRLNQAGGVTVFAELTDILSLFMGAPGTITAPTITNPTVTTGTFTNPTIDTTEAPAAALAVVGTPAAGELTMTQRKLGNKYTLTFTLILARISVTDGAGSGSHGSLKIADLPEGAYAFLGARQNYTAFAEGAALTTGVGDAVFEIGVGTTAISAAADGTLGNGVNENVGQAVSVTNSGGTGTGTAVDGTKATAIDGTTTAPDLYLNWSGTAATIDGNSTIDVTGTITVEFVRLGDD